MNVIYENTKMMTNLPSSIRDPRGGKGSNHRTFMVLAIVLSFCLLAPIPLFSDTGEELARGASAFLGQSEGVTLPAETAASRGFILLAQADETPQSFENFGSNGSEKPTPQPKSPTGPSSITNVSDLEGCWASAKGGETMWTGVPHYFQHCFDKSGTTQSLAVTLDSSGNKLEECRTSRQAKMEGKGFVLEKPYTICPGWFRLVFDCKLRSPGTVECMARGEGGQTPLIMYYNADLKP